MSDNEDLRATRLSDDLRGLANRLNAGYRPTSGHPEVSRIYALVAKAERLEAAERKDCVWTYDDDTDHYDTSCGNAFVLIEGRLRDNEFRFCAYCGGGIVEAVLAQQEAE